MKNTTKITKLTKRVLERPVPKPQITVSVKLAAEIVDVIDEIALRSGKTRGFVAKTILELGSVQMGHEWNCLPESLQDFYTGILVREKTKK